MLHVTVSALIGLVQKKTLYSIHSHDNRGLSRALTMPD